MNKITLTFLEKMTVVITPFLLSGIAYAILANLLYIKKIPVIGDHMLFNLIERYYSDWIVWVIVGIVFIVGIFIAMYIYSEILKITVERDRLHINFKDKQTEILKKDIMAIFKEQKELVIITMDGRERIRAKTDYSEARLQYIFNQERYPWQEADPYKDAFYKWQLNDDGITEQANDILYKRREAIREDEESVRDELKADLSELGIVVKDVKKAQYIRVIK